MTNPKPTGFVVVATWSGPLKLLSTEEYVDDAAGALTAAAIVVGRMTDTAGMRLIALEVVPNYRKKTLDN